MKTKGSRKIAEDVAEHIANSICAGVPLQTIARIFHVGIVTVYRVRKELCKQIWTRKEPVE